MTIYQMSNILMDTLLQIFNRRLRLMMSEKGFSQVELCDKAGIVPSYFSRLINGSGDKRWNFDNIVKIVNVLEIPAWQLFVDPKEIIPPELLQLHEKYSQLNPAQKRVIDLILNDSQQIEVDPQPKTHIKKG